MSCTPFRERMSEFMDGELEPPAAGTLRAHLRECAGCAGHLHGLQAASLLVRELPRAQPSGSVAAAVADRIEIERRGPGLQLLFRPAWKARPLMFPSLIQGTLVLALILSGVLLLDRGSGPAPFDVARRAARGFPVPPLGTEANPLFPSSSVAVPQRLLPRSVLPPLLWPQGEDGVLVETIVARDGSVSAVTVIHGDSAGARALADSLRRERFQPTRVDGRPVAVSLYRLFSRMEVRATRST